MPFLFIGILNSFTLQQGVIATGYLDLNAQATQVVTIKMLIYFLGLGESLATSATTLVGNKIGKGDAYEAYQYFKALLMSLAVWVTLLSWIIYAFYELFIQSLTNVHKL